MLCSSSNAGLLGARAGGSHQVPRFGARRAALCCRNRGGDGAMLEERSSRPCREAGILLGSAAFLVASGLSASDFARAEPRQASPAENISKLPQSAIPDLFRRRKPREEAAKKDYKVPSRVLRAKTMEKRINEVLKKIEEEPDNVVAHKALLLLRMENGDVREAIEVLGRLIELEPENLEYRFMRARAYDIVGDVRRARDEFQELVEIQPFSAKALQGLALAMEKNGEDEAEILEMIEDAIKNARDQEKSEEARNFKMLLGQILTTQEKLTEALAQYEELSKEDPTDFRPYLCQGLLYDSLGNKEAAQISYKKYKELCPESFPQRKYLDDLLVRGSYGARLRDEAKDGMLSMELPSVQDVVKASKRQEEGRICAPVTRNLGAKQRARRRSRRPRRAQDFQGCGAD